MPAGNLTLVNIEKGTVVAAGLKTTAQAEKKILEDLKTYNVGDKVTYAVLSPYKAFGDQGIRTFEAVPETEGEAK